VLLDPQVIEATLAGRQPAELEAGGRRSAELGEEGAAAGAEQIGVALLVAGVAQVEAPEERVGGELGGARQVAAAVGLGAREGEELARPPRRIAPHPAVQRTEQPIPERRPRAHDAVAVHRESYNPPSMAAPIGRADRAARLAVSAAAALAGLALALLAVRADRAWFGRHVAPTYCAAAVPAWPILAARAGAVAVALLLVLVVRPRLARVPARELLATAVLILPALALALGAGELILRRVQWEDRLPREVPMTADPRLGWVPTPGRASVTRGARSLTYTVDAQGARVAGDAEDAAAPTLVVAGESIAFGFGLDWDETFGAIAGRALGLRVVDVAAPAYGADQAYLRLADALPRLVRPELVVFLFVAKQIRRDVSPARPHLVLGADGRLELAPAASGLAAWRLARLVSDEPYHGDAGLRVTRAVLVAADAAARARGARPLFVLTNYGPACPPEADGIVGGLFAGLPVVRVELDAGDVIGPDDPHPSARGARKLAEAILAAAR
jgi:hypothetical protein